LLLSSTLFHFNRLLVGIFKMKIDGFMLITGIVNFAEPAYPNTHPFIFSGSLRFTLWHGKMR